MANSATLMIFQVQGNGHHENIVTKIHKEPLGNGILGSLTPYEEGIKPSIFKVRGLKVKVTKQTFLINIVNTNYKHEDLGCDSHMSECIAHGVLRSKQ